MALVFFQFAFKTFQQGEGVCGTAGKADQYFAVIDLAHLARSAFHDDIAKCYLAIAAERNNVAATH
ncbi:hypothetical protein D1872_329330 [compost metagenome]